jgi:hypothetical protein
VIVSVQHVSRFSPGVPRFSCSLLEMLMTIDKRSAARTRLCAAGGRW